MGDNAKKKNSSSFSDTVKNIPQKDTWRTGMYNFRKNPQNRPLSYTDSFLLQPFNVYKFKEKDGQSNSGYTDNQNYFFKPNYAGFYYHFFLFNDLSGYIGTDKRKVIKSEHGVQIITYKPYGKYQAIYLDPGEELIEVSAVMNLLNLPELAFIGLDSNTIISKLGSPSYSKKTCFVYVIRDRVLAINFKHKKSNYLR